MKSMNKIIYLVCTIIFVNTFYSCTTRKVGFFNNHYQRYEAKKQEAPEQQQVSPSNVTASEKTVPVLETTTPALASETSPGTAAVSPKTAVKDVPADVKPSRNEKKAIRQHVKGLLKEAKKNDERSGVSTLLLVIIAILIPPVAVLIVDGLKGPFWLDILLTLLFYVPGLIYALYRIFR